MDAVQAMTGRGGWPMTVFLTPDGQPFYGGTYFPKPNFLQLMAAIDDVWRNRPRRRAPERRRRCGNAISAHGAARSRPTTCPASTALNQALQQLAGRSTPTWGGFGAAPKFPPTMSLDLVLRAHLRAAGRCGRTIVTTSLDAMACGRHLRPPRRRLRPLLGRPRVARAPLREDALRPGAAGPRLPPRLASSSASARWRQVVDETDRATCCATCARPTAASSRPRTPTRPDETAGHEGLFYMWTIDEVRAVLGDDADAALDWYGVTDERQLRGPHRSSTGCTHRGELARPPEVEAARRRLFEARAQRPPPGLDDKVLTEWNALMLATLAEAARRARRADWLDAAVANGRVPARNLRGDDGRWLRSWQADGDRRPATTRSAADHAALVDAFTRLAEATGRGPLDRRGVAASPTPCSTSSGTPTTAACSPPPTTARRSSPARRT